MQGEPGHGNKPYVWFWRVRFADLGVLGSEVMKSLLAFPKIPTSTTTLGGRVKISFQRSVSLALHTGRLSRATGKVSGR